MHYKPLVSLVIAFVATSSVAASATPIRRGVGGLGPGYGLIPPALPAIPVDQCDSGNIQCCNGSGMNCDDTVDILSGDKCDKTVFCCQNSAQSTGLPIQCVPVIFNL